MNSQAIEAILVPPFEWCLVSGGVVDLADGTADGGTRESSVAVGNFAISKYLVTNAQFQKFVNHPNGYANPDWWAYSREATQWRGVRTAAHATAFAGDDLPRTRVSWFESMAFCAWLSRELEPNTSDFDIDAVATWRMRLPTEAQWQRAAIGDTGWRYPWGNDLDESRANFGNNHRGPTSVLAHSGGASPFGVLDMIGNLSEWCLTKWATGDDDVTGYGYRSVRGYAWNVHASPFWHARDRYGHPPRGRLNDFGFRVALTAVSV